MKPVPNCIPYLAGREAQYLQECIDTGWVSSVGPFVDRLETEFAEYHGVEAATSTTSGTAAIHLALLELGVAPGDLVICPTMTFVGTVNPIRYCHAEPVFLDCEPDTLNLDPNCLEDFLSRETERKSDGVYHRASARRISALVVVHLYGIAADMDAIQELASEYELPVLEDAAESLGARYGDWAVGTMGDIGCFSFNGNKVITSGGGGMILSRDPQRTARCKHLSTTARCDSFDFVHDEVGYNYRMSNLCAAVGCAQLECLDDFIARKRVNAMAYADALARQGKWDILRESPNTRGTYWMTIAKPCEGDRRPVLESLRRWATGGIGVRPIWHPLHDLPMYRNAIYFGGRAAIDAHASMFCLPSSVGLTEAEIERVVQAIHK